MITTGIRHSRTLDYCDGIQVFEAKDPIGGNYIATLLETRRSTSTYLVVGCEPDQLRSFRAGGTDLRKLIKQSATSYGWYLADIRNIKNPFSMILQEEEPIPEAYLPGDEFYLTEFEINNEITSEALQTNSPILEVTIDPAEASEDHRIRATTLSGLIDHVQTLTRYAVLHANKLEKNRNTRSKQGREAYLLDAIGLSIGSTKITFQAVQPRDPSGESPLARGLEQLDRLFEGAENPELAREALEPYDKSLSGAYINLMLFLKKQKTSFSYTWAAPEKPELSHHAVPLKDIESIASNFVTRDEPRRQTVFFEGILEMADEPKKRWRLRDREKGVTSGTVSEDGPSLSSVVIDDEYRIECLEELTISHNTIGEKRTLYLQSITPLI